MMTMLEVLLSVALAMHGVSAEYDYAACIVQRESNWQVDAVGAAGEIGLSQIKPSTGDWWAGQLGWADDWDADTRLYDSAVNLYLLAYGLSRDYDDHWTTARGCRRNR